MKRNKPNKGLLDKTRFEKSEQQKKQWLKKLSWKKAIELEQNLISSELIWEWRRNFSKDNPVSLANSLRKK